MGETDARVRSTGLTEDRIRDAATVVLLRQDAGGARVLMGQRGSAAVFMPSKYVFPGGGVDASDRIAPRKGLLAPLCADRLQARTPADAPDPDTLATAALRELVEETGLHLAAPPEQAAPAATPPLRFIFRAITPPGRSRRFDARFFLIDTSRIAGDLDDFTDASDELGHLHWIGLSEARALDLPFITEVVLAEVAASLAGAPDHGIPFFDNSGPVPTFRRL
ncbi:NUDIX hydrolase [Paragemmobacter straminiformis]|uniref:NUDIX hydrolase n=1 Tax=Paragemmobacter straminiformis TaxID=2045119 RepID=A0A842IBX9_9RHOB|nr:NUDIX hydrolase [Gemmobacter straminiformis]MBC2837089.1 NUDIX hydrolase [Gemmobacter straminiformis]